MTTRITLAFFRGGEVLDARPANDRAHAVRAGLLMLAQLDALQDGEQLTVVESRIDIPAPDLFDPIPHSGGV